jgi:hypothetical protein
MHEALDSIPNTTKKRQKKEYVKVLFTSKPQIILHLLEKQAYFIWLI